MQAVAPALRAPSLRPYQLEAHAAILIGYRERGVNRQLVALATGLGKTVLIAGVPKLLALPQHEVTLIIAHRKELIAQTVNKVRDADPAVWVDVEMAEKRASPMARVVVGSIASLTGKRLTEFMQRFSNRISLCIIDEAHHAAARAYLDLVAALTEAREDMLVLGVTATPQRSDNVALSIVFDEVVYHRDVRWAMTQGWLVPVACWQVKTNTSLAGVETYGKNGDYVVGQLEDAVNNAERNDAIVSAYLQHTPGYKAIAFCVGVGHAKELARVFCKAGIPAESVDASTPESVRTAIFQRVKSGETQVLSNCGIATEGYDEPTIQVVIGARPTKSNLLYSQMAGRALRPLDEVGRLLGSIPTAEGRRALIEKSAKPQAIIMDVVDQARKLSLVTFPSLWGVPPKINPQGRRVIELAEKYDELASQDPVAAEQVEMFEQIATQIEKIDLFAVPQIPPEIEGYSDMSWMMVSHDAYRLNLPSRSTATDRTGAIMHDFDRRLRDTETRMRNAQRIPVRENALTELNVDAAAIVTTKEHLEIRPDPLNKYEVYHASNGTERVLGVIDDLPAAFSRAENWITNNRPMMRSLLAKGAPWKAREPSDGQIRLLKSLGLPEARMPRTQGEASEMIAKAMDGKKKALVKA